MRTNGVIAVAFLAIGLAVAEDRLVSCSVDSPERRGQEGCSILASRPLVASTKAPLFWHVDRFESLAAATKAAGPDGLAAEAHGSVWLMTVESRTDQHRGGQHVAAVGPLALPPAGSYTMRVHSTLLEPGATTPVHTHSGPEVFYIVSGEQCLEMKGEGWHLKTGETRTMPADVIHRGRVFGSTARRALGLVLHDAARPGSSNLNDPPPLVACRWLGSSDRKD
jgi:quercetin dioxygenase-like cupin family protein